jgi:hypothetical protein
MTKLGWISIVVGSVACGGGGSGGGTGPLSQAGAEEVCQVTCERDAECDPDSTQTVAQCVAACAVDLGGGGFRTDAANAIVDCIGDLACTADEDVCLTKCTPTSTHVSYEARCREKAAACGIAGEIESLCETTPSTTDEEIGIVCLFTPAAVSALDACFDQSCETIGDCFEMVFTEYGLNL